MVLVVAGCKNNTDEPEETTVGTTESAETTEITIEATVEETAQDNTDTPTQTETSATESNTSSPSSQDDVSGGAQVDLIGEWKPVSGTNSNDAEIDFISEFGTGYRDYGGSLTFKNDGTFALYIGISDGSDTMGTYSFDGNSLSGQYSSGKDAHFSMSQSDDTVSITAVWRDYTIKFEKV